MVDNTVIHNTTIDSMTIDSMTIDSMTIDSMTIDSMTIDSMTIDGRVRAAAERRPEQLALADAPNRAEVFEGVPLRLSWGELDNAVDNLAMSLAELGVSEGSGVAIQLPNVAEKASWPSCCRLHRSSSSARLVPLPECRWPSTLVSLRRR